MTDPLGLDIQSLALRAGSFAHEGLSLQLERGTYALIMGGTGCGKTLLLEAICGLRQLEHGTIQINGQRIDQLPPAERHIGYVPQDGALFLTMTARRQIALPLEVRGETRTTVARRVNEVAEMVNINHLLERKPTHFSGGERQRVAIARAIASPPNLLLMDEPIGALDETMRARVLGVLQRVHEQTNVTTVHVTHDPRDPEALNGPVFRFQDGELLQ